MWVDVGSRAFLLQGIIPHQRHLRANQRSLSDLLQFRGVGPILRGILNNLPRYSHTMQVSEAPVYGAVCRIIWGDEKSTVSVSLLNDETETPGPLTFGVLAYALPYRERTITSVLISSEDQMLVDSATQVSEMLAALLKRPVFVNSTVKSMNPMLMKSIKEFVEDELR